MIKLTYILDGQTYSLDLSDGSYVIGRSKQSDIVLAEPSVSGQHLRLDIAGDTVSFRDLVSRNGTAVDGKKLMQGTVRSGQTLRLGHLDVKISGTEMPPHSAARDNNVARNDNLDDFAAPPPLAPAPALISPSANYAVAEYHAMPPSNVEVFDAAPEVTHTPAKSRRLVIYLAAAMIIFAVIVVVLLTNTPPTKRSTTSNSGNDERYWSAIKRGADDFAQNEYAAALKIWETAEITYGDDSVKVGRNFATIAKPFAQAQIGEKIDDQINWNDRRLLIRQMFEQNLLTSELHDFANMLQRRCQSEQTARGLLSEATNLRAQKLWDEAAQKYREIPAESLYYAQVPQLLTECEKARLIGLKEDAFANAKNLKAAIAAAEEFFKRGGEDQRLQMNLERWENDLQEQGKLSEVRQLAESATTINDITIALQKMVALKEMVSNATLAEILALEKILRERKYVAELTNAYQQGNNAHLDDLLKESTYNAQPQVRDLRERLTRVREGLKRAEDFEKKGDFEMALAAWRGVVEVEKNSNNAFMRRAAEKIAQYPEAVLGKTFLNRAETAFNEKNYRAARGLLKKAEEFGASTNELAKKLSTTGNRLFNEGIAKYNNQEFAAAGDLINDARECFLPSDDFYPKIEKRMQTWNIKPREK